MRVQKRVDLEKLKRAARPFKGSREAASGTCQLARERYGREAVLVGFTTYTGTVTAASDWNMPAERKRVRPGMPNSYEELFEEHLITSSSGNVSKRNTA